MKRFGTLAALAVLLPSAFCLCAFASASGPRSAFAPQQEEQELQQALAEAGSSPVDAVRALERHLARYPKTARRPEIERAIARTALEIDDEKRILEYGERVLAREHDDFKLMDRVARALLSTDDKDRAARALEYAREYERALREYDASRPERISAARWREEVDRSLGRALVLEARAQGVLGHIPEAIALARRSYETSPTAESAREIARWLARSGHEDEAILRFADAFTIADSRARDSDRASDRKRMGDLYRKLHGSENGLGDIVLDAYDRTAALIAERALKLRQLDPNIDAAQPAEFVLTAFTGEKLSLASLKGKVVVLDFWATWCTPCRAQHPLYQQVAARFKERPDVVFVSVNTDEDRSAVASFLAAQKWQKRIYFEDGLALALRISSIPTAVLLNRRGEVSSRMNGFIPERFVEMLTERIREALSE